MWTARLSRPLVGGSDWSRQGRGPEDGSGRTNRVCDHKVFRFFEKNLTL